MPTAATIYTLNAYAAVFQKFGTLPVRWEKQTGRLIYRLNHRELLFWYFNSIVILFGTLCSAFICVREIFVKVTNVPTYVLVIQIFLGLMGAIIGCGFGLLLLMYGQVGTTAWNNICLIENTKPR